MLKLFVILLISFLNLSLFWDSYDGDILNRKDLALQENQDHPALHSPSGVEPQWESFNEWHCFPTYSIQVFGCYDERGNTPQDLGAEERDGQSYILMLALWYEKQIFLFESASYLQSWSSCLEEGEEWVKLIKNQKTVCFFAARFPAFEEEKNADIISWIVYGLKTFSGRIMAPRYEDEVER